jgi:hypothetical protein
MSEPNVISNLNGQEWAAWVQAVGSILAIIGAASIAIWQSNKQQKNSLELLSTEHRLARLEVAKALLSLSINSLRLLKNYAKQLPDRSAVHNIGHGVTHLDTNELKVVEGAIQAIPLYSLPHQLVSLTMMLGSTIRQFREHVELVIKVHQEMDAEQFNAFFTNMLEMQSSLKKTCDDIQTEVSKLQDKA